MRVITALLVLLALTGCGTSKSAEPREPSAPGVAVLVTADWGSTVVEEGKGPPETALAATAAAADVDTEYGGRYVTGIAGERGDGERDWLFRINGIEADVGAADVELAAGNAVWWDLRRWPGRIHIPLAIGAWPDPFAHGYPGTVHTVSADAPVAAALSVTEPAASDGARVLVGADADLRGRDPDWAAAANDPAAAGLTAWIEEGAVRVWNAERGASEVVPDAVAVMVGTTADRTSTGAPIVVVAGLTSADAERAAAAVAENPALIRHLTAACFDAEATVVCAGGRGAI